MFRPAQTPGVVGSSQIAAYIAARQEEGAKNASINRELAALKRMFKLGVLSQKVHAVPHFPHLEERNVRTGFVEEAQYTKLARECAKEGLWMRALLEVAYNFGWRRSELLNLRVKQVDLLERIIRLEPGTTKNDEGREVAMTDAVYLLLQHCVLGKRPEDFVFTREDGEPVRDFRDAWAKVCCAAGVGQMVCATCLLPGNECKCEGEKKQVYRGLIFHDLRRTGARNLKRAGVSETVAMKIGGWKTRSVFDRYSIVSESDLRDAARKLERQFDHSSSIVLPEQPQPAPQPVAPNSLQELN